jgi:hypothetical protein
MIDIKRKAQGGQQETTQENAREALHKAAAAYHARHTNQAGADYWDWALNDLQAVAGLYNDDPLILDLLNAVLKDLEREYKRLLAAQENA